MNALKALDEVAAMRPADNINQLHIKIIRCIGLQARRKGSRTLQTMLTFCAVVFSMR